MAINSAGQMMDARRMSDGFVFGIILSGDGNCRG
jgi:hypothetical protein